MSQERGKPRKLPAPDLTGEFTLESVISERRTCREFDATALTLNQIAQLCWAGQGLTEPREGLRAAPSAGALYPIELYLASAKGVEHYDPVAHGLEPHLAEDVRPALQAAALNQEMITEAPLCMAIASQERRLTRRYGTRSERYCLIEVGHVAQNILLQATALGLAGVPIGAYEDPEVAQVLHIPKQQTVYYLLPIGLPRE